MRLCARCGVLSASKSIKHAANCRLATSDAFARALHADADAAAAAAAAALTACSGCGPHWCRPQGDHLYLRCHRVQQPGHQGEAVEHGRGVQGVGNLQVLVLLEIIFTSCATESNNLAIKARLWGMAGAGRSRCWKPSGWEHVTSGATESNNLAIKVRLRGVRGVRGFAAGGFAAGDV